MKKRRARARAPGYDLLVKECHRRNLIADAKALRDAEERYQAEQSPAARRARVEAEERKLLAELAERDKNLRNPPR